MSSQWMWELDHKEGWVPKNWCFWTVVLEKTLESPLDCKEIKPVNPKGNQSWIFIRRSDAEADATILWPPDAKNWLTGKDPDAVKDWRLEENGTTEDGMVGWHHWLDGHEFEQAPGVGDEQWRLVCCSPWSRKELDWATELNWTFKVRFPGDSQSLCPIPGLGSLTWCSEPSLTMGELLWYYCSPVCVSPTGMGFGLIVIAPLLPSCWNFFFVFGCGLSFIGCFQHPSVDG